MVTILKDSIKNNLKNAQETFCYGTETFCCRRHCVYIDVLYRDGFSRRLFECMVDLGYRIPTVSTKDKSFYREHCKPYCRIRDQTQEIQ
jgi:hypothetical protein